MNSYTSNKTVFYCRKSSESEDRQALSIDSQINECTHVAQNHGIDSYTVIQESKSAKQPSRPKFSDMIGKIHTGEFDTVICWKLDRLARNPVDGGTLIWLLEKGLIKRIITPSQVYYPEDNHLLMYVEFGMASQYSRDLSVNVKRGNKTKLETGWWSTVAPMGYLNNPDKTGDPIINDPNCYHLVKKMWRFMLTGRYSIPEITTIANDLWGLRTHQRSKSGGSKLSRSAAYRMFNNTFYYGYMIRGENEAWGKHEPMVTKLEFDRVQDIINKKAGTREQSKRFAFMGMIQCAECGCAITAETKKNRHGKYYTYYHCTGGKKANGVNCSQKKSQYVRLENLEKQIIDALESFNIPDRCCDWLLEYTKLKHKEESRNRGGRNQELRVQYDSITRKIDRLIELKLDRLITEDEFKLKKRDFTCNLKEIERRMNQSTEDTLRWYDLMERTFKFANKARSIYTKADLHEKNEILLAIGTQFQLKDKKLLINWSEPFEIIREDKQKIVKFPKNSETLSNPTALSSGYVKTGTFDEHLNSEDNFTFEPSKIAEFVRKKEKTEAKTSEIVKWRGMWNTLRTLYSRNWEKYSIPTIAA